MGIDSEFCKVRYYRPDDFAQYHWLEELLPLQSEKSADELAAERDEDREIKKSLMPELGSSREENWNLIIKGFLEFLLRTAKEAGDVTIKRQVKALIEGKMDPERFFQKNKKLFGNEVDPVMVEMLKNYLGPLQASLRSGELTIEGLQDETLAKCKPNDSGHCHEDELNDIMEAVSQLDESRAIVERARERVNEQKD